MLVSSSYNSLLLLLALFIVSNAQTYPTIDDCLNRCNEECYTPTTSLEDGDKCFADCLYDRCFFRRSLEAEKQQTTNEISNSSGNNANNSGNIEQRQHHYDNHRNLIDNDEPPPPSGLDECVDRCDDECQNNDQCFTECIFNHCSLRRRNLSLEKAKEGREQQQQQQINSGATRRGYHDVCWCGRK